MLIYMVTNVINGKCYVGQTVNSLRRRKRDHISAALRKRENTYFHNSLRKYGSNNFEWAIIHDGITTIEDLNRLEILYIGYYDTYNNGYNLTLGGGGTVGRIVSDEAKRQMSERMKGKHKGKDNPNYGKHLPEKTRKKISESKKGRYAGKDSPNYGKKRSKKTKRRISETKKGTNIGNNYAIRTPITIDDKYFDTRKEAAKFVGVNPATIRYRILHKTKWPEYRYAEK